MLLLPPPLLLPLIVPCTRTGKCRCCDVKRERWASKQIFLIQSRNFHCSVVRSPQKDIKIQIVSNFVSLCFTIVQHWNVHCSVCGNCIWQSNMCMYVWCMLAIATLSFHRYIILSILFWFLFWFRLFGFSSSYSLQPIFIFIVVVCFFFLLLFVCSLRRLPWLRAHIGHTEDRMGTMKTGQTSCAAAHTERNILASNIKIIVLGWNIIKTRNQRIMFEKAYTQFPIHLDLATTIKYLFKQSIWSKTWQAYMGYISLSLNLSLTFAH